MSGGQNTKPPFKYFDYPVRLLKLTVVLKVHEVAITSKIISEI